MQEWLKKAHTNAGWIVALGVLQIILGVIVLSAPMLGGLAVTTFIGFLMLAAGIARLFAAFFADSFGSGALAFLWGLLVAGTGFYMFTNPGLGLATITLVLSMMFFVSGLSDCLVALQVKPAAGWGWTLTGGIVSVLLAVMIWRQFPLSGIWLVGTLVGIHLLLAGMSTMTVGSAARKLTSTS